MLAPGAAYFLLACFAKTQIGYRHILPVYPFLIVAGACGAAVLCRTRWGSALCLGGSLWLVASVGAAYPHYLAYFNEAAGGPAGGWRWLVDSNLDWGQDLKGLAAEVRRRVCEGLGWAGLVLDPARNTTGPGRVTTAASTLHACVSCSKMMPPGRALRRMRRTTRSGSRIWVSRPRAVQPTTFSPSVAAALNTRGFERPMGGRK